MWNIGKMIDLFFYKVQRPKHSAQSAVTGICFRFTSAAAVIMLMEEHNTIFVN